MGPRATTSSQWVLDGTLPVIVVEDNPQVLGWLRGYLESCPLLDIYQAECVDEAVAVLASSAPPIHCCVMDLGLPEASDGFGLLEQFAADIPFLVVTARNCVDEASHCHHLNAVRVLGKTGLRRDSLIPLVCESAVRHKFRAMAGDDEYLRKAVEYLYRRKPVRVGLWIGGLGADESYFRDKWSERGLQPKAVLYCHMAYRHAIDNPDADTYEIEGHTQRAYEWLAMRGQARKLLGLRSGHE